MSWVNTGLPAKNQSASLNMATADQANITHELVLKCPLDSGEPHDAKKKKGLFPDSHLTQRFCRPVNPFTDLLQCVCGVGWGGGHNKLLCFS